MPLENLGHTRHNPCMESAAISKEIEDLESQLSSLRTRVDEDNSSFSALEQQIAALQDRLTEAEDAVRAHEAQLAEKRAELSQAQHHDSEKKESAVQTSATGSPFGRHGVAQKIRKFSRG